MTKEQELENEVARLEALIRQVYWLCERISERPTAMGYEDIEDLGTIMDILNAEATNA